MLSDAFTAAILGPMSIEMWLHQAPTLGRHFLNSPRKRLQQSHLAMRQNFTWAYRDHD